MSFLCLLSSSSLSVSKYAHIVTVKRVMQHFFPDVGVDHVLCRKLSVRRLQTHVNGNESSFMACKRPNLRHATSTSSRSWISWPSRLYPAEAWDSWWPSCCPTSRWCILRRARSRVCWRDEPERRLLLMTCWLRMTFTLLRQSVTGRKGRKAWINFCVSYQVTPTPELSRGNYFFAELLRCWFRNGRGRTRELHCAHVSWFEEMILISRNLHLATGIGFWTSSKF